MDSMQLRTIFEAWFLEQFGTRSVLLLKADKDGAYIDQMTNAIWVGFVARDQLGRVGLIK
jgi:hypothetical protein